MEVANNPAIEDEIVPPALFGSANITRYEMYISKLPLFDWQNYDSDLYHEASADNQLWRLQRLVEPAYRGQELIDGALSYLRNINNHQGTVAAGVKHQELLAMRLRAAHTLLDALKRASDIDTAVDIVLLRQPEGEYNLLEHEMSLFVRLGEQKSELCIGVLSYDSFLAAKRQGYMDLCEAVANDYIK